MDPYRTVLDAVIGRPLHYLEVYPASEGFVAIQVGATDPGLTLMLDYGIFYEFVPAAELGAASPRCLTLGEVRVGEPYVILLTTPAGLWSYVLGDTVRFVSLDPPQLVITGRTGHFVNAFGENVIVEEIERAAAMACVRTGRSWSSSPWRRCTRAAPRSPRVTSGPSSSGPTRRVSTASREPSTPSSSRSTRTTAPSGPATWAWPRRA